MVEVGSVEGGKEKKGWFREGLHRINLSGS